MDPTDESNQVFEIVQIAPVLPDIWFVQGRALQDIRSGDTLAIEVLDSSNNRELALFKVVTTSTYGYLLSELNRGLTGGVTLVPQGRKADISRYERQLHGAKYLLSANNGLRGTP